MNPCFHCGSHLHELEACPSKKKPQSVAGRYAQERAGMTLPTTPEFSWEQQDRQRWSGRKGGGQRGDVPPLQH